MTEGGRIALLEVTPKKPTTASPAEVVVIEGATSEPVPGVKAPLCESTGALELRFLKSMTEPAADACEPRAQLYAAGSDVPATLK
jgi:hypothetical protein